MATNVPGHNFDSLRAVINPLTEVGVALPDVRALRLVYIQTPTAEDIYLSFTPGGTFSTDNFWTIKSDQILPFEDIEMQPLDVNGTMFYVRSSATTGAYVEVIYAQG